MKAESSLGTPAPTRHAAGGDAAQAAWPSEVVGERQEFPGNALAASRDQGSAPEWHLGPRVYPVGAPSTLGLLGLATGQGSSDHLPKFCYRQGNWSGTHRTHCTPGSAKFANKATDSAKRTVKNSCK